MRISIRSQCCGEDRRRRHTSAATRSAASMISRPAERLIVIIEQEATLFDLCRQAGMTLEGRPNLHSERAHFGRCRSSRIARDVPRDEAVRRVACPWRCGTRYDPPRAAASRSTPGASRNDRLQRPCEFGPVRRRSSRAWSNVWSLDSSPICRTSEPPRARSRTRTASLGCSGSRTVVHSFPCRSSPPRSEAEGPGWSAVGLRAYVAKKLIQRLVFIPRVDKH